ncbi:MAG: site-specific integrase [Actinomycetota bacterium]|nr:site-specific integrase [Actinomycetota bacterium]
MERRYPLRPLPYTALRAVLNRINARIGADITLHGLRHTLCQRLIEDPGVSLVDIQQVMRHRWITTTSGYLRPRVDEVIARVQEHYSRPTKPVPDPSTEWTYDQDDLAESVRDGSVTRHGRTARTSTSACDPALLGGALLAPSTPLVPAPEHGDAPLPSRAGASRAELVGLAGGLLVAPTVAQRSQQQAAAALVLDWLQAFPGGDWQDRWILSGSDEQGSGWGPSCLSPGRRAWRQGNRHRGPSPFPPSRIMILSRSVAHPG